MPRANLNAVVQSLSEFKANATESIEQLQNSGRPIVLTQRGQDAAVLLDIATCENLVEKISMLRDVDIALAEARDGRVTPQAKARRRVLAGVRS